jgi:pseudaminic acid cytidylyltransferase
MRSVAIIPARGGSKRIPDKNIRSFLGKPIITYSIGAALESGLFDEVMVSTDSDRIAEVAAECGAVVPFLRSEAASDDFAPLTDVLLEVIRFYSDLGKEWESVACLLPTAPFIKPSDLLAGYNLMQESGADAVVSVARFSYPIQRALRLKENKLSMANPEYLRTRSQDLEPMFHDAGQFYLIKTRALLEEKTLFCGNTAACELDEIRVQDIDTESDWKLAELKYRFLADRQ